MMKALIFFEILNLTTADTFPETDTIKKVLVVFRHGDRAPVFELYPNDPNRDYHWTNGYGNLTTLGKTQALTLGTTLRRRYEGFLHADDVPVTEAYARSSAYLRCIITTICVLTGIYEPDKPETCYQEPLGTGFTPVPVYTVEPRQNDQMLNGQSYCPRYNLELQKIFSSPAYANYLKQNQDLLTELQNLTGVDVKNLVNMIKFYDTITVEKAHGLPQPSWLDPLFPAIKKLGAACYNFLFFTEEAVKLIAGVLLNDILTQLNNSPSQRLYLYGTHDINVLAILKILRLSNDLPPPYTAAVIIELHEREELMRSHRCVQIFYRNSTTQATPFKMNILGCPEDCCPLKKFVQLTEKNAVPNPEKECRVPTEVDTTRANKASSLEPICPYSFRYTALDTLDHSKEFRKHLVTN